MYFWVYMPFKEIHTKTKQPIRFQDSFKVTNQIEVK